MIDNGNNTKALSVRLPIDLYNRLEEMAQVRGNTVTNVTRRLLAEAIENTFDKHQQDVKKHIDAKFDEFMGQHNETMRKELRSLIIEIVEGYKMEHIKLYHMIVKK